MKLNNIENAELWIDREQAVPLEEGENYIADLIGLMDVYDEEEKRLGVMTDVLQTGANDVYVVETEERKGNPASGYSLLHPYGGRGERKDGCADSGGPSVDEPVSCTDLISGND
ncbi:MAG: PRC-barrel domain-containing protein [Eubacteriales bacterium]